MVFSPALTSFSSGFFYLCYSYYSRTTSSLSYIAYFHFSPLTTCIVLGGLFYCLNIALTQFHIVKAFVSLLKLVILLLFGPFFSDDPEAGDNTEKFFVPFEQSTEKFQQFYQKEEVQKLAQEKTFKPFVATIAFLLAAVISEVFIGPKSIKLFLWCNIIVPPIIKFGIHMMIYNQLKPLYDQHIAPKLQGKKEEAAPAEEPSTSSEEPKEEKTEEEAHTQPPEPEE